MILLQSLPIEWRWVKLRLLRVWNVGCLPLALDVADSGFSGRVASVEIPSTANLFESMGWFLSNLDQLCGNVEKSLLKPFSQKFTEWALQPWSDNKGRVLSESTSELRKALRGFNQSKTVEKKSGRHWSPVLNPKYGFIRIIAFYSAQGELYSPKCPLSALSFVW